MRINAYCDHVRGGMTDLSGAILDNSIEHNYDNDKEEEKSHRLKEETSAFWQYFLLKTKRSFTLTEERKRLIRERLTSYTLVELKRAVDSFVSDKWEGRKDYMDLIYCIGKQRGKGDNLERWLNCAEANKKGSVRYE